MPKCWHSPLTFKAVPFPGEYLGQLLPKERQSGKWNAGGPVPATDLKISCSLVPETHFLGKMSQLWPLSLFASENTVENQSSKDYLSLERGLCEQNWSYFQWRNSHPSHVDSWNTHVGYPCLCLVTGKRSLAGFALPVPFSFSVRWSRQQGKKGGNDTAEITVSSDPKPCAQLHTPQAKKDKFSWKRCFEGWSEEDRELFGENSSELSFCSLTKQELRHTWLRR